MNHAESATPRTGPLRACRGQAAVVVVSASLAMAATLPGRTIGLGLITTRLLDDIPGLTEPLFGWINLIAALAGALGCLLAGWLLDRWGARRVLLAVLLALALSVFLMSRSRTLLQLTVTLTLTRTLGQSMLSVLSITMLGKWLGRHTRWAMGGYAVLMTVLLAVAVGVLGDRVSVAGWRPAWAGLGTAVLVLTPLIVLTALRPVGRGADSTSDDRPLHGVTLGGACRTRCFWAFALGTFLFSLASAGVGLFMQPILIERGIAEAVFHNMLIIGMIAGLVSNLVVGRLATRLSMSMLFAVAMFLLAAALIGLGLVEHVWQAYAQAVVWGVSGGAVTVLFFAVWVRAFGPAHLGQIQGAAQLFSVVGSALGPAVIAQGRQMSDDSFAVLALLAAGSLLLGLFALLTPMPPMRDQPELLATG